MVCIIERWTNGHGVLSVTARRFRDSEFVGQLLWGQSECQNEEGSPDCFRLNSVSSIYVGF